MKILLTIAEASTFLRIPTDTLYKMCAHRQIPHYKPGKRLLFDQEQLETWMISHYRRTQSEIQESPNLK